MKTHPDVERIVPTAATRTRPDLKDLAGALDHGLCLQERIPRPRGSLL